MAMNDGGAVTVRISPEGIGDLHIRVYVHNGSVKVMITGSQDALDAIDTAKIGADLNSVGLANDVSASTGWPERQSQDSSSGPNQGAQDKTTSESSSSGSDGGAESDSRDASERRADTQPDNPATAEQFSAALDQASIFSR